MGKIEASGESPRLPGLQEEEPEMVLRSGTWFLGAMVEGGPAARRKVCFAPAIVGVDREPEAIPRHGDVDRVQMGPGDQGPA